MAGKKRDGDLAGAEMNEDVVKEAKAEESDASETGEEAHGGEEKKEMKTGEELKRGGRHKRARGGGLDGADEFRTSKVGDPKPHSPHHHPRKRGGHVPGKASKHRPDKRARGGATSDLNPTTAAGKMSVPSYERQQSIPNGGGVGTDNDGKQSQR